MNKCSFWLRSTRVFHATFHVLSDTKVEFPMNFYLSYWLVAHNNYEVVYSQSQLN